jgi:hypothetical protein
MERRRRRRRRRRKKKKKAMLPCFDVITSLVSL